MSHVLFLLICAIWGSSFILMKKAGLWFGPLGIGGGRVLSGAAVLVVLWILYRGRWRVERRAWPRIAIVGLITYCWPYALQPYLVVLHGSGFIGMMVAFTPLLTILVSVPMLGIYPTPRQLLGVVGGLLCLGVIMADGVDRSVPLADLVLAVTVPLSYAIGNNFIRLHLRDVPALPVTAGSFAVASMVLVPLSFAHGILDPLGLGGPQTASPADVQTAVLSLAVLGVIGTGITTFFFNKLIVDEGPLFAGMVTYLVPLGALAWGVYDHEQITAKQIAALVGVLSMVFLVQYGAARKPVPRPAQQES